MDKPAEFLFLLSKNSIFEEIEVNLADLAKPKKLLKRKQRSEMPSKFGHKADMTTIIFTT